MSVKSNQDAAIDKELLETIASLRDKVAFEKIFVKYAPRIKSFGLKLGANNGVAEEIVQETMVAIWRKAHLYNAQKGGASTWIYTIARNKSYDMMKNSWRPEPDYTDPLFASADDILPDTQIDIDRKERNLRKIIKSLPEEQAQLLKLSFYNGKSHRVISDELNIPLGTVKSRLRLALKKLRENIGDRDDAQPSS